MEASAAENLDYGQPAKVPRGNPPCPVLDLEDSSDRLSGEKDISPQQCATGRAGAVPVSSLIREDVLQAFPTAIYSSHKLSPVPIPMCMSEPTTSSKALPSPTTAPLPKRAAYGPSHEPPYACGYKQAADSKKESFKNPPALVFNQIKSSNPYLDMENSSDISSGEEEISSSPVEDYLKKLSSSTNKFSMPMVYYPKHRTQHPGPMVGKQPEDFIQSDSATSDASNSADSLLNSTPEKALNAQSQVCGIKHINFCNRWVDPYYL